MIVLGLVCIIIGAFTQVKVLIPIGLILLLVGIVLAFSGHVAY